MAADARVEHAASIAATIADYRSGEIARPTAGHVLRWAAQFDDDVQNPLLAELAHVLERSYLSSEDFAAFLSNLAIHRPLVGDDARTFWASASFFQNQLAGRSQRDMVTMFAAVVREQLDTAFLDPLLPAVFIYLDDGVFSGNRLLNDLRLWIEASAPARARVEIITMVLHSCAVRYVSENVERAALGAGKVVELGWWAGRRVDNCRGSTTSDVLRPKRLPDDEGVRAYAADLRRSGYPVELRRGDGVGALGLFLSASGRDVLEQELLKAGVRVRAGSPALNGSQRPLGNWRLNTLGFGTMFVTFRNCPNNAPLALWAGDPWYPLFRRRTN